MQKNSKKETNSKSQTNNSKVNALRGNIMENNLVEALCELFNCQEVIDYKERRYQFRSLLMSSVEGILLI